ncbi:MerR family transcriptional regulator [bacterium]|nr:MerR family transcriptional regulator [bacterium]
MEKDHKYPINIVAQKTGLSSHVIRVWERRYGAVVPERTATNRRLYSDADIEKLMLLGKAVKSGHGIGNIAELSAERLRQILSIDNAPEARAERVTAPAPKEPATSRFYLEACMAAVKRLDGSELERAIGRAAVALSQPVLIDEVLVHLIHRVGEMWHDGRLRVIHEHLVTAVIRSFWGSLRSGQETPGNAPNLVITTPAGQLHELGAVMAAATAAAMGWKITYLGPNLPAEEIAAALEFNPALAVALSIVYPEDDPLLENELRKLRRYLPREVALIVGGRAVENYKKVLEEIGASLVYDMAGFRETLAGLRRGQVAAAPA